jgi:ABC-type Mn2+/Zn2+ transport system permease subunit
MEVTFFFSSAPFSVDLKSVLLNNIYLIRNTTKKITAIKININLVIFLVFSGQSLHLKSDDEYPSSHSEHRIP